MSEIFNVITGCSTLALAILTLIIARYAHKAFQANEKALYGNTISNSRPPYISSLRMSFAALHSSLLLNDRDNIIKSISLVKYHLDQYEAMGIDNAFIENCLDKLLEQTQKKHEATKDEIDKYKKWSSAILKYEWQSFKDEILKGSKLTCEEKMKNKVQIIDAVLVGLV